MNSKKQKNKSSTYCNPLPYFCSMNQRMAFWVLGLFLASMVGCKPIDIYEKNESIPNFKWNTNFRPSFQFNITDTTAQYQLFAVLRHNESYRYNNIWLQVGTETPGDSVRLQRVDIMLGSDDQGWRGSSMGDIWELREPLTPGPFKFKKPGTYRFTLTQIMRENPLEGMLSAGIRLERVP